MKMNSPFFSTSGKFKEAGMKDRTIILRFALDEGITAEVILDVIEAAEIRDKLAKGVDAINRS